MQSQWEEKLAAYVRTSFDATMLSAGGQNAIQYVSKLSTAALLLLGAKAVIDGDLSVGSLIAFNMIAGQVTQPVLRLSQLWQDFQQVKISVDRLGEMLNYPAERQPASRLALPTPGVKSSSTTSPSGIVPARPTFSKTFRSRSKPVKRSGSWGRPVPENQP
jgi:subfamily B ATP-binding cassette protein HlyB/CyaB